MKADQNDVLEAFLRMKPRPVDAWVFDDMAKKNALAMQIKNWPAFALPSPENAAAIVGVVHAFGVGLVWMVTGEGFENSARRILPISRQLCKTMYKVLNLHRMSMEIEQGRKDAEAWAESLGFEFETVLQRNGPRGENQSIFLWPDERKRP